MSSIYHFFRDLVEKKEHLRTPDLEKFPFDTSLLSCKNEAQFPDLAIRISNDSRFQGGELIEIKSSKSYSIASFNSTIPTGKKEIEKLVQGNENQIRRQMEDAGDNIASLPVRDVFYLLRGAQREHIKVCLVHGSFFETIRVEDLIQKAFGQAVDEALRQSDSSMGQETKDILLSLFSEQEVFSKTRNIEKATVKMRFRVMTEAKAEGNLFNTRKYPLIKDDTLNLLIPCHNDEEVAGIRHLAMLAFEDVNWKNFTVFSLKHLLNGHFLVFQHPL
jgi:hypothetical protein